MATIELNNDQLRLIQQALDLYSRVGIGQFSVIKDHPTFQKHLYNECIPNKKPEVGDRTSQGEILEIKGNKALIEVIYVKNGQWNKKQEWKKLKDVKLSTDYSRFHLVQDEVDNILTKARNTLIQDYSVGRNGGWGIHNPNVDNSCREAYDLIQIIRHEFWKANPNRSDITVDSSVHLVTDETKTIKVTL